MRKRYANLGLKKIPIEVFKIHPLDGYARLAGALDRRISKLNLEGMPKSEQLREIYFLFLASLQLNAGIAGDTSKAALLKLTLDSLRDLPEGWLYLPRFGGEIPMPLDPVSCLLGMALHIRLGRGNGKGRNRVGEVEEVKPIVEIISEGQKKSLWRAYRAWLAELGREAGLAWELAYAHFLAITHHHFAQRLAAVEEGLIELQLNEWPHNPAPIYQEDAFWDLAKPLNFSRIVKIGRQHDSKSMEARSWQTKIFSESEKEDLNDADWLITEVDLSFLDGIKFVINQYQHFRRKPAASTRRRYRAALEKISTQAKESLLEPSSGAQQPQSDTERALVLTWLIAGWLAAHFQGSGYAPGTVSAHFYHLRVMLEMFPRELPYLLSEDHLEDLKQSRGIMQNTFNKYLSTLYSFRMFVQAEFEVQIEDDIDFGRLFRFYKRVRPVRLITRPQLEEILGRLLQLGETGRLAFYAVLIQINFGFRASSALELRLDGFKLRLGDYPTILAPPLKKRAAFDHQIPYIHLDADSAETLGGFARDRLKETQDDKQLLLASPEHGPLTYEQYREVLKQAMQLAGLEDLGTDLGNSTHLMRHYAANRWLALGLSLRWIRDHLNHRHESTSVESYLHGISFVLARHLFGSRDQPGIVLQQTAVAALLGTSTRQVRNLAAELFMVNPSHRKYGYKDVRFLAHHYFRHLEPPVEDEFFWVEAGSNVLCWKMNTPAIHGKSPQSSLDRTDNDDPGNE